MIDYNFFRSLLAQAESTNRYDIDSPCWGKYQFCEPRRKELSEILGISPPLTIKDFTPELQETFLNLHIQLILQEIENNPDILKYLNTLIIGKETNIKTQLNIFGLLVGRHFAGFTGMMDFLINGIDKFDGNKYLSDYMAEFSEALKKKGLVHFY